MFRSELSQLVEHNLGEFSGDPRGLPYRFLFESVGINPNHALTIIPFLNKDRQYLHIPGNILRINDFSDGLRNIVDKATMFEETIRYRSTLPEVPLIALDLRYGIPVDFKSNYGTADLFIVNHGIILSGLDANDPNAARNYLTSISNATRRGSLIMVIQSEYDNIYNPDLIASYVGATTINDAIDDMASSRLAKAGLRQRHLNHEHSDSLNHISDYIVLPESHENEQIFLYRKD